MKVREYDTYKAIYCGLCRQLGKRYGPFARLTLSYDFTFLSILAMAVDTPSPQFTQHRCPANPLKVCNMAVQDGALCFAADCAMVMLYYKVQDDLQDHGWKSRLRAALMFPFAAWAHKRAAVNAPEIEAAVAKAMARQSVLEKENCSGIDAACQPTAEALEQICMLLSDEPAQKRILGRIGYLTGRYVYLCDALDDLEDDLSRNNYNPFIAGAKADDQRMSLAIGSLYLTIGELGAAYALLPLHRYGVLLENIIDFGMKQTVDNLALQKGAAAHE